MKVIAHRGASSIAPENTISSFKKAQELGANAIELDVHMTLDGVLVVHHDYVLGHTDNGEGLICDTNWEYINSLDAGAWFSNEYKGEKIPRLEDVFSTFGNSIQYELELKGSTLIFLTKVIKLVESMKLYSQIEFTSPHNALLFRLKELKPDSKNGMIFPEYPSWMGQELGEKLIRDTMDLAKANVAHLPLNIISQRLLSSLHNGGFSVHIADVNKVEELSSVLKIDCDQFSTNDVQLAVNMQR